MTVVTASPSSMEYVRTSLHRAEGAYKKTLVLRDHGVGGFELQLARYDEGFHASRHFHAFDQFRIGLEGPIKYGENLVLRPRMVGYFPAGTAYGPHHTDQQASGQPFNFALLQYDGTGEGYHCAVSRLDEANERLQKTGAFEKGFYQSNDGTRVEAWQASFREATGRTPVIPPAKYSAPIFMNMDAFAWKKLEGTRTQYKVLGVFGEPETRIEMLLLPAGESVALAAIEHNLVVFVIDGETSGDGQSLGRWSSAFVEANDTMELRGESPQTELLVMKLPRFAA
jgi:hypothetical protein